MNTPFDTYRDHIKYSCPDLPSDQLQMLINGLSISKLSSKQYYIEAGAIQDHIGYISSGLIRAFYIDEKGNEVNVCFIKEGEYVTHYPALISKTPGRYFFQCIEPTVIINIPYNHLMLCCDNSHQVERYLRLMVEDAFAMQQRRIEGFVFDNAEKRYLDFVKENPDIFSRVSLSLISSYLGIERQSLTRIRKRLLNK